MIGPKRPNAFGMSVLVEDLVSMPKPCGIISAPKEPWSTRVAMSASGDQASAHGRMRR